MFAVAISIARFGYRNDFPLAVLWRRIPDGFGESRLFVTSGGFLLPDFGKRNFLLFVAEREAALAFADEINGTGRVTLASDKNYDTHDFVKDLRALEITPHVAQNNINRRSARMTGDATSGRPEYRSGLSPSRLVIKSISGSENG